MDDFTIYQGVDITPYVAVTSNGQASGTPIDLSGWTAATWVAYNLPLTGSSQLPLITKHEADMSVGIDPQVTPTPVIENCIFIPLSNQDLGSVEAIGQFRHELRITLGGKNYVVYPLVGVAATFTIDQSISWNVEGTPPAPRFVKLGGELGEPHYAEKKESSVDGMDTTRRVSSV
jgi:hypothetical protein